MLRLPWRRAGGSSINSANRDATLLHLSSLVRTGGCQTAARVEFMVRHLRLVALIVYTAVLVRPLMAESTPAPPDWKDNGTSVYLGATEKTPLRNDSAPSIPAAAAEPEQLTT